MLYLIRKEFADRTMSDDDLGEALRQSFGLVRREYLED
jgi:hypothetical protein